MRTYAFLTTRSFRVEATAKTARKAYTRARRKLKRYAPNLKRRAGKITSTYIRYNKDGFQETGWRKLR